MDDAAVQNGRRYGWDLQHLAVPSFSLAGGQRISTKISYELLDLLDLPFGKEGLGLVDGCLWHNHTGRAVFNLCEDLDGLSCKKKPNQIHSI